MVSSMGALTGATTANDWAGMWGYGRDKPKVEQMAHAKAALSDHQSVKLLVHSTAVLTVEQMVTYSAVMLVAEKAYQQVV